jgi:hypothetical protein
MEIAIIKNMQSAPNMGSRYGQDVEPKGTYVIEKHGSTPEKYPWVDGKADLKNPLFVDVTMDTLISYKYDLAKRFKAKGQKLTNLLMQKGYDAIVTRFEDGSTGEIILFPNAKFMLDMKNESKSLIKNMLRESLLPEAKSVGPITAYHGSPKRIVKFVDEFVGAEKANDREGPGIYFSSSFDDARHYGEYVHTVSLTPRKLLSVKPSSNKMAGLINKMVLMATDWELLVQDYHENPKIGLRKFIEATIDYNENEKDVAQQIWFDFYRYDPVDFVRNMVKLGIDGLMVPKEQGVVHYIIYNPDIIKIQE